LSSVGTSHKFIKRIMNKLTIYAARNNLYVKFILVKLNLRGKKNASTKK
jgi:hypothetical protein